MGGVGRIAGAVAAGVLLAGNGLMATLLNKLFDFNTYQMLIAGFALMITAVANPDGIAKEMQGTYFKLLGRAQRVLGRSGDEPGDQTPPPPAAEVQPRPARPSTAEMKATIRWAA